MKKYLINGAMALIVGGFLASCTHDDVGAPATVNDRTKSFDEMFTELYGPIAENHNWGFATVAVPAEAIAAAEAEAKAATRAEARAATRTPADFKWEKTDTYDMEFDKPFYQAVFTHLPEGENAGSQLNNYEFQSNGPFQFCIIFSKTAAATKVGYYYYNPSNETPAERQEEIFVENIQSGGLYEFYDSHWYSTTNNTMEELFNWGVSRSHAKIFTVNIPAGYRVGFFTINGTYKMYSNKSLNSDGAYYSAVVNKGDDAYLVGLEDWYNNANNSDFDCNDVIMAINKSTDTPPTVVDYTAPRNPDAYKESKTKKTYTHKKIVDQGRVFCEDIATANMKVTEDIDYNDIVFDARVWQIYDQDATTINNITSYSDPYNYRWQYDISLLATGGTIEEKINGADVHNKFSVGQAFMVNTWTTNCPSTLSGQWNTRPMEAVDFSYTLKYNELPAAPSVGINTIPIEVHYGGKQMVALENRNLEERTSEDGNKYIVSSAPYKLCLPVGTLWPIERANIQSAYSDFSSYVSSPENLFYKGTLVPDKLYTQAPESSIQKDGKTTDSPEEVTQSGDAENSNVWVVWKGDVSSDATAITLYNFTFQQGQVIRFFGTGTITVAYGANNSQRLISSGSMSDGYVDVTINSDQASALSDGIMIYGSNFTLTKIVVF